MTAHDSLAERSKNLFHLGCFLRKEDELLVDEDDSPPYDRGTLVTSTSTEVEGDESSESTSADEGTCRDIDHTSCRKRY